MAKKSRNKYISMATSSVGLGIGSMAGGYAIGKLGGMEGMPHEASGVSSAAMGGIQLANIGNMANIGMNIMPRMKKSKNSKW